MKHHIHISVLLARASYLDVYQLIPQADYVVPVEIEWQWHNVYVIKRPGVDNFLKQMGELYEVVVFTASLSKVSFYNQRNEIWNMRSFIFIQ